MSKEIKIDEIITASTQRASSKTKRAKVVEEETRKTAQGNATGMPGDFSEVFNNPDMVKMFAGGKMPGFGKLPLKQRIMFRLMGLFGTTKGKGFLRKRWWPLWAIVLLLLSGVLIVLGALFLVYKVLKMILGPYIAIFTRKG